MNVNPWLLGIVVVLSILAYVVIDAKRITFALYFYTMPDGKADGEEHEIAIFKKIQFLYVHKYMALLACDLGSANAKCAETHHKWRIPTQTSKSFAKEIRSAKARQKRLLEQFRRAQKIAEHFGFKVCSYETYINGDHPKE